LSTTASIPIENEQRLGLQPIVVQRELSQGVTRAEIARRLGKSKTYVTFVCAMIDPPDWLLAAYRANQCRGLQELYELRRLHETEPDKVEAWLAGHGSVTRKDTLMLREQCATTVAIEGPEGIPSATGVKPDAAGAEGKPLDRVTRRTRKPRVASSRALRVVAVVGGVEVRVVTDAVPAAEGQVFVADDASGNGRRSTPISALQSIRLIRV
jgi:ParB family transcriptional regulator, chromosome partitioning protein